MEYLEVLSTRAVLRVVGALLMAGDEYVAAESLTDSLQIDAGIYLEIMEKLEAIGFSDSDSSLTARLYPKLSWESVRQAFEYAYFLSGGLALVEVA